jgi:DNA-binding transcriptional regulator/RsmH inhibitor MraZ
LKLFAGLDKDIVIAGSIDHFEFWNRERYDEYMDQEIGESEELQEMHNRLGF